MYIVPLKTSVVASCVRPLTMPRDHVILSFDTLFDRFFQRAVAPAASVRRHVSQSTGLGFHSTSSLTGVNDCCGAAVYAQNGDGDHEESEQDEEALHGGPYRPWLKSSPEHFYASLWRRTDVDMA